MGNDAIQDLINRCKREARAPGMAELARQADEADKVYADSCTRTRQLEGVCDVANQALSCIEDWQGMASTKQAADDSLWRLHRALQSVGKDHYYGQNIDWRGSILKELNDAGFYPSTTDIYHAEQPVFVYDPTATTGRPARVFGNAVGPTLTQIVSEWIALRERNAEAGRR